MKVFNRITVIFYVRSVAKENWIEGFRDGRECCHRVGVVNLYVCFYFELFISWDVTNSDIFRISSELPYEFRFCSLTHRATVYFNFKMKI